MTDLVKALTAAAVKAIANGGAVVDGRCWVERLLTQCRLVDDLLRALPAHTGTIRATARQAIPALGGLPAAEDVVGPERLLDERGPGHHVVEPDGLDRHVADLDVGDEMGGD